MPSIDFSSIEEAGSFTPIPECKVRARVADVEESSTQYGDEMWRLAFTVIEGEHEGRQVFDNIVFSQKAAPRVKLICSRLGLDVSAAVDLTPDMLLDRTCLLTVEVQEYEDADGRPRKGNRVPFSGYDYDPGKGRGGDTDATDVVPF